MTAQDLYRVLVRDQFGPALRAEGLTGSGAAWMVPSDTHFAVLGWQKRRSSTAATVEFTANLKVVSKATWFAQDHPKGRVTAKPEANLSYGLYYGVTWEHRIGELMGVPHGDHDGTSPFNSTSDSSASPTDSLAAPFEQSAATAVDKPLNCQCGPVQPVSGTFFSVKRRSASTAATTSSVRCSKART